MTKKDLDTIAKIIGGYSWHSIPKEDLVERLIQHFTKVNPHFDRVKFYNTCFPGGSGKW